MPLDAVQNTELKSLITAARQRAVNFGFRIAAKPEDDALVMHRNKSPETLGREAKTQAHAMKAAFGSLAIEGTTVHLTCENKPPTGVAKRARNLLKLMKLNMKVRLVGKGGEVFEEDGEEEPETPSQVNEPAETTEAEWTAMHSTLEPEVLAFLSLGTGDVGRVRSAWAMATDAAGEGDYTGALNMGRRLAQSLAESGGATPDSAEAKWVVASGQTGPRVEEALANGTGPADKIRAVWAFATGKAQSRNFESALKSLIPLEALLQQAAASKKSPAETAIKPSIVRRRSRELNAASDVVREVAGLGDKLKLAAEVLPGRVKEIRELVAAAQSAASTNDLDMARVSLTKLEMLLADADRVAPEKAKWDEARAKIEPLVSAALAKGNGDVGKMRAVWDFALGKAEVGAFTVALRALTPIAELLKAAGRATQSDAEASTTPGAVDKARYEAEVPVLAPKLEVARKIGGFNDELSGMAVGLRQAQAAVQAEVVKPDYAAALKAHYTLAAKVAEIIATKAKYDTDKLTWQQKLAADAASIETVEGCGPVSARIDVLKQPFDAAMLRARAAAADRRFDVAVRELDDALARAKTYLDAKALEDAGKSRAFAEARSQGAAGLASIPPVAAADGSAAAGVAAAMEDDSDLDKSRGLQELLAEARLIDNLYADVGSQSLRGQTGAADAVIAAAERAITNCAAYQNEHKADARSKTDRAKFAQAEVLVGRYRAIITGLRGLKQTYGQIDAGLAGDIAAKGKAIGLLQAMTTPPAPAVLQEGARQRMREATVELMKAATCPDQVREVADLMGGELKAQFDRQVAEGSLAQTANASTKAAEHAATKVLDLKRAENVDQSKLLANRLIGPQGQLEVAGLFACGPEGLADKAPAKKHMARTLKNLREDPEAWAALESIPAPQLGSTGDKMIRATLGLAPDAHVGAAEARKAALSALLTDLRQQDVGSCFATQTAIRVHDSQPASFLKDMAALMKTGAIERSFDGVKVKVALEGQMSDQALETNTVKLRKGPKPEIKASSRGGDLPAPAALESSPAFAAVFDQLGIADGRSAVINAAITHMQDSDEFKLNQNRKALKAAAAGISDAAQRKAVLQAAQPQVTEKPASVQMALSQAMAAQNVPATQRTNATDAAASKLSALDYDVEPGLVVRQLVMGKVGLVEQDFKNVDEFRAKTTQVKTDPRMSRVDENGQLAELLSPADDDLKKLISEVEALDKKIDWAKMKAFETAKQGSYDAFLGGEDNRLLRAWEYSVSALAEAGSLKTSTADLHAANKDAMQDELDDVFNDMTTDPAFKKAKVKQADFNEYTDQLMAEYQRLYDDIVSNGYDASTETEDSADGSSSRGAHYLYDTQGASSPADWIKIDDQSKYQVLVSGLVMLAWSNLFAKDKDDRKRKITRSLADKIADKLGSDAFIAKSKQAVQTATGEAAANPWELPGGSQARDVIRLYDERPIQTTMLGPSTGAEVLTQKLASQLRTLWNAPNSELKASTNADPDIAGINARVKGVHAFTLSASDPKLKALIESSAPINVAINAFKDAETQKWQAAATATPATDRETVRAFCVPIWGKNVRDDVVTEVTNRATALATPGAPNHDHLAKAAKKLLEDKYRQSPEASAGWAAKATFASVIPPVPAAELPAKLDTLAKSLDVPEDLIPAVTKRAAATLAAKDPADVKTIQAAIRSAITDEGLDLQADIERCTAAVRERPGMVIADSNWGDAEHHVKYAMVVNPVSGVMEMWQMNEDGSNARRMDQDKWAKREWWTVV